jgi:hypothetical protein
MLEVMTFGPIMTDQEETTIRRLLGDITGSPNATPQEGVALATKLLSVYPRREMNSDQAYFTAIAAHFAENPLRIGMAVADHVRGLPSRSKYQPSVSEVAEALTEETGRQDKIVEKAERRLESLSFRKPETSSGKPDFDTRRRIVKRLIKQGLLPPSALLPLPPGRQEVDE